MKIPPHSSWSIKGGGGGGLMDFLLIFRVGKWVFPSFLFLDCVGRYRKTGEKRKKGRDLSCGKWNWEADKFRKLGFSNFHLFVLSSNSGGKEKGTIKGRTYFIN